MAGGEDLWLMDGATAERVLAATQAVEGANPAQNYFPARSADPPESVESPIWQYFRVTACPDATGLYTGNIVQWDGTTETTLITGAKGIAAQQPLTLGLRYPARLTYNSNVTTTTTTTGTGTSSTTTTTTTSLPPCTTTSTTTSTTTTPPGGTTTSTTTTQPPLLWSVFNDYPDPQACFTTGVAGPGCTGRCEWTWSAAAKAWNPSCYSCSQGCQCPRPRYCGSKDGECTTTYCSSLQVDVSPPCCGATTTSTTTTTTGTGTTTTTTTTTSTTTTTTSTAPPPNCTAGCTWTCSAVLGQWILTSNGCASTCPCPVPQSGCGPANDCAGTTTACVVSPPTTTTLPPPPSCTGSCQCYAVPGDGWIVLTNNCVGVGEACLCQCPSEPANPCVIYFSYCAPPVPPTTTTGTTATGTTTTGTGTTTTAAPTTTTTTTTTCHPTSTTPPPGKCTGTCTWGCDGMNWYVSASNCTSPCNCAYLPPYPCTRTCQTFQNPCAGTTTTTSSTTTSTTTTCGNCSWLCVGVFWVQQTNTCTGSCFCSAPIISCFNGQTAQSSCGSTTTTTLCPTTTTPGGATCGQCQYVWCNRVPCDPPVTINNQCTGGCVCPAATQPCRDVVSPPPFTTVYQNCISPPTTTTTAAPTCGECIFTWNGSIWKTSANNCSGPCLCQTPGSPGTYVGQQGTTNCA